MKRLTKIYIGFVLAFWITIVVSMGDSSESVDIGIPTLLILGIGLSPLVFHKLLKSFSSLKSQSPKRAEV